MASTLDDKARVFRTLHQGLCFVMPNPWDAGSARVLAGLGFAALATSSGAAAGVLGRGTAKSRATKPWRMRVPSSAPPTCRWRPTWRTASATTRTMWR